MGGGLGAYKRPTVPSPLNTGDSHSCERPRSVPGASQRATSVPGCIDIFIFSALLADQVLEIVPGNGENIHVLLEGAKTDQALRE